MTWTKFTLDTVTGPPATWLANSTQSVQTDRGGGYAPADVEEGWYVTPPNHDRPLKVLSVEAVTV